MIHEFKSTGAAYDACQTREELEPPGIVLHVPSESVVGLSWTWPLAVTQATGQLHSLNPSVAIPPELPPQGCREAAQFANLKGYPLAPQFAAIITREAMA